MISEKTPDGRNSFTDELERLVRASRTGDFNIDLNGGGLSGGEAETIRLLNEVIGNYRASMEYDLMKYKLTSDALSIALWDMDVVENDPVNPVNSVKYSRKFCHMLGFDGKNDFPEKLGSWSDRLHPEDREKTINAFAAHINDRTGNIPFDVEYRLALKNGEYRSFHAFGATLRNGEGIPLRVAGGIRDIEDQVQMRETMEYRNKLLYALDEMDFTLLSQKHEVFDEIMNDSLNPIAAAADLDRIVIYYIVDNGKEKRLGQKYRWDKAGGGLISLDHELMLLPRLPAIENWIEVLSKDKTINLYSSIMSPDELAFLRVYGVKSILLAPVITNGELWGAVAFQDHISERRFDDDCVGFLKSAARLCANAIIRNEKTQNEKAVIKALEQREKMLNSLNEMAVAFLSHENKNFDDIMSEGIKPFADTMGLNRFAVYRLLDENGRMGQIYLWMHGNTVVLDKELEELPDVPPVRRWLEVLTRGECVHDRVGDVAPDQAEFMGMFGIKSILFVPIFINEKFWGIITLENLNDDKYFEEDRLDLMRSAAHICAGAVVRAEMEREISKANQLNRTIVETMPVGMINFDENARVLDCNNELVKMFGAPKQRIIDHFFDDFSPQYLPDGRSAVSEAHNLANRAINGEKIRVEWPHQTAAGKPVPCDLTLTRVESKEGYIGLGFIYDLRYRKRMEQELIAARELAERSSNYKSAFLANMSHEIRTPINAIMGVTEIQLQDESLSAGMEEALGRIYESGNLLMGIINDILDLSKIEAGKMEILPVNYDIPSLINDTVQLNRLRYDNKPIAFSLNIDADTPLNLIGDELRIKQILNNILSNAFKYTNSGSISLAIYPEPGDNSDVMIVFRVSDTGQGMTEEQVSKLFDEYSRFNMGANRTTVGTGLGMSITKRLVDLMRGEIYVESEFGKGSTFTVRLPQKRAGDAVCGAELADRLRRFRFQSTAITKRVHFFREHMPYGSVLVVDDVESNLYVTRGLLMAYGLQIETVSSGFEAIDRIKDGHEYDIVFMDHMMPRMDGVETTRLIRGMGYTKPIVALTANALVGRSAMFIQNGFDGYITKPIDSRELNALLNDLIRNKKPPEVMEAARREQGEREKDVKEEAAPPDKKAARKAELEMFFKLDAENAISVLDGMCERIHALGEEDTEEYTVTVHGIKSALINIGEKELSADALRLERAGKERDLTVMANETRAFIDALRSLLDRMEKSDSSGKTASSGENAAYLREKLMEVKAACAAFDKNAAKAVMDVLMQKTWPRQISDKLEDIFALVLHSSFRKASAAAEEAADMSG